MRLFSTHLSDQVAEEIWEQREEFMDGRRPRPHKLIATVLFTDIQGFTPLSEKMEPHDLMSWLNEYMEVMVGEISRYKGVVNKYIGDAIMAVFGIPIARTNESEIEEDAVNAVNSAIAMGKVLARLNISWEKRGLPSIRMRVGIYTGPVMVGSVGGANRLEYTVVGDTVNIASRLESYDKQVDPDNTCRILMGDTTYKYAGRQFDTELLTQLPLKGKKEVVSIYRVSG